MVVMALFNSLAEAVTLIDPLSGVERKISIAVLVILFPPPTPLNFVNFYFNSFTPRNQFAVSVYVNEVKLVW